MTNGTQRKGFKSRKINFCLVVGTSYTVYETSKILESQISLKEDRFRWVLKEILSTNISSKLMCSLVNVITKQKICTIKVLLGQRNGFSSEFG